MILNVNDVYPMLKIKTPKGTDFYQEHSKVIDKSGYVWFCRFGKNNMKFESFDTDNRVLIIKEGSRIGGGLYVAKYEEFYKKLPNDVSETPDYYNDITQDPAVWFKIIELKKMDDKYLDTAFVVNASGGSIRNILKSMCPAFFVKCLKQISL